ncbi:MAG: hypothetical protein RIR89_847 [Actinomycetota bacterium]|jgi:RNA polymerase sigma-70 factor (ECF subfamily)
MTSQEEYREDPLEQLLDEETDEDFGLPEFKEHLADTLTPAVLKDWSAADFASIYVRFRPHLERHARRFLVNPSQVEEVVQDAFLYLMTTLPELDSELGVLKFLKWKVRLLSLDVIRANSRASFAPLDDQPEMAASSPELSLSLERADDAAIVALALAKLQPRHREVLIASIYEEKSTDLVAAQMGLSENATRQLLFRARSAFKKALIGEADTAGLSVGQILSLAARKANAESGKYLSAAGAFLLVLAVSIGVIPNLSLTETPSAAPTQSQPAQEREDLVDDQVDSGESSVKPEVQVTSEVIETDNSLDFNNSVATSQDPIFNEFSLSSILETDVAQAGYYTNSYASSEFLSAGFRSSSIEVFGGTGVSAFLDVDFANLSVHNVVFQMWVDGKRYYAVAEVSSAKTNLIDDGKEIIHESSVFWVVDDYGNVFDASPLSTAVATVRLSFDANNNLLNASLQLKNQS